MAEEETTTTAKPEATESESESKAEAEAEAESKPAVPNFPEPEKHWFWGLGRRKRAVARVRIRPGEGKFLINKREVNNYFPSERDRQLVVAPLSATDTTKNVDVFVNVKGGGTTGQAGAVAHGLGRALLVANPDYMSLLKEGGFLTRDSRKVERKKPGQPGARKRFQFSKR